jgi:hypothetical protein
LTFHFTTSHLPPLSSLLLPYLLPLPPPSPLSCHPLPSLPLNCLTTPQPSQLNQRFLTYLRERLVQWSGEQQIGDIFVHVADELKLYTTYSLSFEEANKVLSEYEKKEKVRRRSRRGEKEGNGGIYFLCCWIFSLPDSSFHLFLSIR